MSVTGEVCEECMEPLLTPSEINEGIHDSCNEEITRQYDLAVASGLCSLCTTNRATTTVVVDIQMNPFPVCQECHDSHNETEAVWNEFVIEHGRRPSLIEYLESGEVFQEDDGPE